MNKRTTSTNLPPESERTLCKYLSLDSNRKVRSCIFENGLFRATQPRYLNDVLSESKVLGYFNEFSPKDKELMKKELIKHNLDPDYDPSDETLRRNLMPLGRRMTTERFPGLKGFTGGKETTEMDRDEFERLVLRLNGYLVENLSQLVGVLSLAQNCLDELMWSHYASEGRSICVEFDRNHEYFTASKVKGVSYCHEKRLQFSYYEGCRRIHGVKVLSSDNIGTLLDRIFTFINDHIGLEELIRSTLFAKSERWRNEKEMRIVYNLDDCHLVKESVYCAKIPFSAFKSVFIGYNICEQDKNELIDKISSNSELSHVKVYTVMPSAWDNLKSEQIKW